MAWAAEAGLQCMDEVLLEPEPYASIPSWCEARVRYTEARLAEAVRADDARLVLINHFPLRAQDVHLSRIPRFSIWCGTRATADWHRRFRAHVVVSGHLHVRDTSYADGCRFEEVSLGYPRQWSEERGMESLHAPDPARPGARLSTVVVGAGVVGASVAYHLVARGARDVVVLDRAPGPGAGSTGRATGGFRVQFASAVNVRLSLLAREKLRRFGGRDGRRLRLRRGGLSLGRERARRNWASCARRWRCSAPTASPTRARSARTRSRRSTRPCAARASRAGRTAPATASSARSASSPATAPRRNGSGRASSGTRR